MRSRCQIETVLQRANGVSYRASPLFSVGADRRRPGDAAFALERFLIGFPGDRPLIGEQERFVFEMFDFIVVRIFLIGRDGGTDDALQMFEIFAGLVHPGHVADGKTGVHADFTPLGRHVGDFHPPELQRFVRRQAQRHFDPDAPGFHQPLDIVLADSEHDSFRPVCGPARTAPKTARRFPRP